MDASHNPYAPSRASLAGGSGQPSDRVWRENKVVVMARDGDLPDRCVKCNDPADEPTRTQKVYWHHPGYYVLLLINVILYVVVALIARKSVAVNPGLCVRHKQRRTRGIWIGWGGLVAGLVAMFAAVENNTPGLGLLFLLTMFGLIITGLVMSRTVYAKRIDDRYVLLKGCGEPFLADLPEFRPSVRDLL
jgi:hypothetical protein